MMTLSILLVQLLISHGLSAAAPVSVFPDFKDELRTVQNQSVHLSVASRGALVVFTSEHCPVDLEWRDQLVKMGQVASKNDINFFVINPFSDKLFEQNSTLQIAQNLAKNKHAFSYVLDRDKSLAKLFKIERTPTALFFNGEKKLIYFGGIGTPYESAKTPSLKLQSILEAAASGPELASQQSDVLGCSIKESWK